VPKAWRIELLTLLANAGSELSQPGTSHTGTLPMPSCPDLTDPYICMQTDSLPDEHWKVAVHAKLNPSQHSGRVLRIQVKRHHAHLINLPDWKVGMAGTGNNAFHTLSAQAAGEDSM